MAIVKVLGGWVTLPPRYIRNRTFHSVVLEIQSTKNTMHAVPVAPARRESRSGTELQPSVWLPSH